MSTADVVYLWVFGSLFFLMYVWLAAALCFVYANEKKLVDSFRNSPLVWLKSPGNHRGPRRMLLFLSTIMGCMAFPNLHVKNGYVSADDLINLPEYLHRRLAILRHLLMTIVITFGLAAIILSLYSY